MKLAINFGWVGLNAKEILRPDFRSERYVGMVAEAEAVGYDTVWMPEVYGADAFSLAGLVASATSTIRIGTGVVPVASRTPYATARAARTLDRISGGRAILGIGASGPQVVEGWHGEPFRPPIRRTREALQLIRECLESDGPLNGRGETFPLLAPGAERLSSDLFGDRLPIHVGAMGPRNLEMTGQYGDGAIVTFFSPRQPDVILGPLRDGWAKRSPDVGVCQSWDDFEVVPYVPCRVGPMEDALAAARFQIGFFIGGMGAKGQNFYNDLMIRFGYGKEAREVQEHFLDYRRAQAFESIPDEMVDEVSLIGPKERIRDRLEEWAESGATMLSLVTNDVETVRAVAEVAL